MSTSDTISVVRVNTTMTAGERDEIDVAAEAAGVNRSQYLRESALARARGELDVETALEVVTRAVRTR